MGVTDHALPVHHADQRHAPKLEEIDLLSIAPRHLVARIGQADERKPVLVPILTKGVLAVRSNGEDLGAAGGELFVIITQARQLRAAVGSHEAPQKCKHDGPAAIVRQADQPSVDGPDFKFKRPFPRMQ